MKHTAILLLAVLALVLAACGGETTATASPTPTAEPTPELTPTPTEEPTEEPTDDGSGSGFTGALSDALPQTIGGLERQELPGMEDMIGPMLTQQGVDADEADFVWAMYGEGELIVTGFAVSGLDQPELEQLARLMSSGQVGATDVQTERATVGGKEVLRMTGEDMPEAAYLYFADDAFFTIISESAELAEELLSQLP